MLKQVADGVLVHVSDFCQSNAAVVMGPSGVLVIDPGIRSDELACLAKDLSEAGHPVVAGFSTHPHWDHLLWHPALGDVPRYATARCAALAEGRLADPDWMSFVTGMMPPELAGQVPLEQFGLVTGLDADVAQVPWDGPRIRIIEHQAHVSGHAALLIEQSGILVAGDMLSDVLVPMLNANAADPIDDYLAALDALEAVDGQVTAVIPGHGSVGGPGQLRSRIEQDRAYVLALGDGNDFEDARVGPAAAPGWEWVAGVHTRQLEQLGRNQHTD